jgi:hypothetical protein
LWDVLGSFDDVSCAGDVIWSRPAFRLASDKHTSRLEALGDDLLWCFPSRTLATGVVGGVEAAQELLELLMGVDGDAQHFAADLAIKRSTLPLSGMVTVVPWYPC